MTPHPPTGAAGPGPGVSIRRLLTVLVVSLVGPLAVLSGYFGYLAHEVEEGRAEGEVLALGDAAASGIHQFLTDSERVLGGLAADPHIRSLDPGDCDLHFPEVAEMLTSLFVSVDLWTAEGELICSSLEDTDEALDLRGDVSFAEAAAAEEFRVSPVFQERRTDRWSTALSYPVIHPETGARGVLSALVDLDRFHEILEEMQLPEEALVTVTDLDGRVVTRSRDGDEREGQNAPAFNTSSTGDPVSADRGFTQADTFEGDEYGWGHVRIPETRWIVWAGVPVEEIYGTVYQQRFQLSLLALLAVAAAVLLARRVHGRITAPLEALVTGVAEADPESPHPLPTDGPQEIAWVAERFNEAWAERTEAMKERERSDARIRSLVENAVTGICVATEGGRFLEVNQAMVDLLGFDSREELLNTPVDAIYETPEARAEHIARHGQLASFRGIPVRWRRKDGTMLDVRIFGRQLLLDGGEAAWEVIVEDVTEATRLQERHAQAQKMEALGRMAGGIAHDFNNLLTVVQGQADLLRDDPELGAEQREQADEILQAAERGAALNHQLLAFGRRSSSDPRSQDLNEIISSFKLVIRRAAGEDVRMDFRLAPKGARVLADRSQVEQVLMNLVVNAKDAMPQGGALTVETREEKVTVEAALRHAGATPGPHVVLSIADTGIGIPPEVMPHIFEPFYSTKATSKGTGLGLATVYGVVANAGGHLRVHSAVGEGTRMEAYFPLHEGGPEEAPAKVSREPVGSGSGVVLLVEDEGGVRRLTQRVLERAGYEVIAAPDGLEALRLAEAHEDGFDLLLTDVVMPGLKGHQVAEHLAASGKISRAVFVSGYPEGLPTDGPEGLEAWAFLAKPFASADLLATVGRVLRGE